MTNPLERLRILINSSTPIVIMETVEEMRALNMVCLACADANLPVFEWSIADGLMRTGSKAAVAVQGGRPVPQQEEVTILADQIQPTIVNTREPAQVLAHLETMTIESVVVLKDFHRHLDDPIVVRRLRDVAQQFSSNRRTLILTGPSFSVPAELTTLIEYLDLPLPDAARLRQIVENTFSRLSKTRTLKRNLDAAGRMLWQKIFAALPKKRLIAPSRRRLSHDTLWFQRWPRTSWKPKRTCFAIPGCWSSSRQI